MAQRTSQGVMDGGSALPSGTAQPALPLAEALGRRNPDQRAPSPALAKKEALYATRPKPPAQLIRATRSFRGSMAGLYAPLPTLRRRPRGRLRTDRGRRRVLLLHRRGLSPHTPCQAPGALTRVAACTLALSPIRDTLIEGFSHFVTSMTAPIASGWSESPGGACTHWKAPPCHGAPPFPPLIDLDPPSGDHYR